MAIVTYWIGEPVKMWRSMMKLPQPAKGCMIAYLMVFAAVFISIPASAFLGQGRPNPVIPWGLWLLGLTAIGLGLVLASDLRGSARAYATLAKDHKIMGVDFSKSFFTTPNFVRILGAMLALVGVGFMFGAATFASPMA